MSEMVGYYIEVKGFKNEQEKEDFVKLAKNFQNAEVEEYENTIIVDVPQGWRGGGLSCKEILQEHFGEWLNNHPHIKFNATVRYLEHCPTEEFDENEIKVR